MKPGMTYWPLTSTTVVVASALAFAASAARARDTSRIFPPAITILAFGKSTSGEITWALTMMVFCMVFSP